MTVTLGQYWMGRDGPYRAELTPAIIADAQVTVERVNGLLERLAAAGVEIHDKGEGHGCVASGWRPAAVNGRTPGAAAKSKHMTGRACDLYDPEGDLDAWCMDNLDALEGLGLWLEHPASTKGWCHVQTCAPGSGNRVFYP